MQCERILLLTLFNSNVSKTEIDTCLKIQQSKLSLKLNNQSVNVELLMVCRTVKQGKLIILEDRFCNAK